MTTHVPLSALRPGGEIDSRSTGLKDGLKELAASIEAHGLILPLALACASKATAVGWLPAELRHIAQSDGGEAQA